MINLMSNSVAKNNKRAYERCLQIYVILKRTQSPFNFAIFRAPQGVCNSI